MCGMCRKDVCWNCKVSASESKGQKKLVFYWTLPSAAKLARSEIYSKCAETTKKLNFYWLQDNQGCRYWI